MQTKQNTKRCANNLPEAKKGGRRQRNTNKMTVMNQEIWIIILNMNDTDM